MKSQLLYAVAILLASVLYAQNDPAPEYLTKQAFPDSVRNFSVLKPDGSRLSFGEIIEGYEGKKIVVDFWASWCKDCIVGLPKLNKLIQKSKEEEVAYVFLSLDKTEEKWKSAMDRYEMPGAHYWMDAGWRNPLDNYIGLDWIPRYLVIDERGRIIMPKAIAATNKELKGTVLSD